MIYFPMEITVPVEYDMPVGNGSISRSIVQEAGVPGSLPTAGEGYSNISQAFHMTLSFIQTCAPPSPSTWGK